MNPYVYSRSKKEVASVPPTVGEMVKSVFTSKISSAVAFAFVLLAAGSTASITALAYPEISQNSQPILSQPVALYAQEKVLGDSTVAPAVESITIDDSSLEASTAVAGKISAKPLSYDSTAGRWDYTISYKISNLSGSATLSIGTYKIQDGITGSGSTQTGAILKPGTVYHVTLWFSDQNGNQLSSVQSDFKTPKGTNSSEKNSAINQQCAMPVTSQGSSASSTSPSMPNFCIKKDDGSSQCMPISCGPPSRHWPMGFGHGNSSSTPPNIPSQGHWSSSTPPNLPPPGNQQQGGMPPGGSAGGAPDNSLPSTSNSANQPAPPPTPRQ